METKLRRLVVWELLKAAWYVLWNKQPVSTLKNLHQQIGLMPVVHVELVKDSMRGIVNNMPYAPFGVAGLTDTTIYHAGLGKPLAEAFVQKR
jgi:hypothetical protein